MPIAKIDKNSPEKLTKSRGEQEWRRPLSGTGGIIDSAKSSKDNIDQKTLAQRMGGEKYTEQELRIMQKNKELDPLFTSMEDVQYLSRADELELNRMKSLDTEFESQAA